MTEDCFVTVELLPREEREGENLPAIQEMDELGWSAMFHYDFVLVNRSNSAELIKKLSVGENEMGVFFDDPVGALDRGI